MSKARNPHIIPTGSLLAGTTASAINIEKAVALEKDGNELSFLFPQATIEKPAVWQMVDGTAATTEFGALTQSSATFDITPLPFVVPSAATIETVYGINLDLVDQISKTSYVDSIGGATIYSIVFTYEAIGFGPKQLFWNFALEATRDTVYGEITNNIAGATIL